MKNFTFDRQFTYEDAVGFFGYEVEVKTSDGGLTHTYRGILVSATETTIQIDKDEVLNECVRMIKVARFMCERCGGTGTQEAGLYNVKTKRYDALAGPCDDCKDGFL